MSSVIGKPSADRRESPSDEISVLTQQRIQRYLDSRLDPDLYKSLRNMSEFVSDDYGNRFLIELIQNAHDAHDSKRCDGEIAVVLDPSDSPHGCLYVANRGSGFVFANIRAISNIALSSKPVNAGIGNKGIGFRSVLQICNWPEVFSTDGLPDSGRFDGYCFRFATEDDLRELIDPNPSNSLDAKNVAREMAENMPCWHVPVPARQLPEVSRFAAAGFATVVRLPLKSDDALALVRTEIARLLALQTPLHLFLDRIGCISISSDGIGETRLERKVLKTWSNRPKGFKTDAPIEYHRVQLGAEAFLLAEWNIDEELFRKTLRSSLAKKEIPESWSKWEGAARVSVAVPLGRSIESGRLYCFLPLGDEGKAPLAGYINANFYTKMDRRTVSDAIGFNRFLLQMATWVSCQAVGFLIGENWPESPAAVVSLLCWDPGYLDQLRHGLSDGGEGILKRALLPVRDVGGGVTWASAERAVGWTTNPNAWLSTQNLCEVAGASVLVDALTLPQRNALDNLYQRLRGTGLAPTRATIADWVEKIAIRAHADRVPAEQWGEFYDEISRILADSPEVLFGKRFLLSVNGDLIQSDRPAATPRGRRAADVYFPPVLAIDTDTDDSDSKRSLPLEEMPARLRGGFALLSRDVPWSVDGGQRPGRLFLVSGKLVRDYDTRDVIRTLAAVTRSDVANSTRQQALEWSFRLWNSARSLSDKETKAAQFFIPTSAGWLLAEAVMFGAGWSVDNGKPLQTFLQQAESHSNDFEVVRARLLPAFNDWPIRHGAEADWIHFLSAAGVADCLRPFGGETSSPEQSGIPNSLASSLANVVADMDDALRTSWRDQMVLASRSLFGSRSYRSVLFPWRLPGQHDIHRLPAKLRRDYAVQVAWSMRTLSQDFLEFRVIRVGVGAVTSDFGRWPTPLKIFLTSGEWLPVTRAGTNTHFVRPSQAWVFQQEEDRPPRFIDLVDPKVTLALNVKSLEWLCEQASLGILNSDRDVGRAIAAMSAAALHGISDIREMRRFTDMFRRMWKQVRDLGLSPVRPPCVPVRLKGAITAISSISDGSEIAYFDDQHDDLRTQLLEEMGAAVFDFVGPEDEEAWKWVQHAAPERFKKTSSDALDIFLDGIKLDEATSWPLLIDIVGSWLIDFLLCVAEHKSGSFVKATQSSLGRLRGAAMRVHIAFADEIRVAYGEQQSALPASLRGALVLHTSFGSVVVVQGMGRLNLDALASLAGPLATALSMREMANGLEAGLLRLAKLRVDMPDDALDADTIALALGVAPEAIKTTRELASGDLSSMLYFALPLAACLPKGDALETLGAFGNLQDASHDALRVALEALADELGMSLIALERRMMLVNDLHELMVEFALPIAKLNAGIEQLGGAYKPVSNETRHRNEWSRYLRLQLSAVVEQLRQRYVGLFDRVESLEVYANARRDASNIPPEISWFSIYDELPEAVMAEHVEQWVAGHLPLDPSLMPLELPIDESRILNSRRLRDFWDRFGPVLSGWVRARGTATSAEVRQAWLDPIQTRERYAAFARDQGWLDFRVLDDAAISHWLTRAGIWPSGQPVLTDPLAWDLTSDGVISSEERAKQEREEQQRRRTEVTFGGKAYSAREDGYADIATDVAAAILNAPALSAVKSTETVLSDMAPASHKGQGSGSGGGGKRHSKSEGAMTDIQKSAIGLMGELWARAWICRRHDLNAVDESVWVSGYRDAVLGVNGGSDALGYDFIVATKSRTYYYEVKASTGDPQRFEMGPTEIIAAQRYRTDREHRYRVLYVSYAGDPAQTRIDLLFNPFSVRGEAKFRMVGRGSVTYEFDPS